MLTTKGIVLLDATFPFTSRLPLAVNAKKVKIRVRITFFAVYFPYISSHFPWGF